jgi:hypothetical protein
MKHLSVILLLLVAAAALLPAAGKEVDVVYLKDGSVLRGTIVERQTYPVEGIVLQTADGLKIPITMDKVQRITKEAVEGEASGGAPVLGGALIDPYAIEVNLLGFLQFGPFTRFHFRVGDGLTVAPHLRVGYAGLLPWLLFDNPDVGVGVSVLGFFPAGLRDNRIYAGGFVETSLNMEGNLLITGGGNAGYRFRFPGGRYWNVGGFAGMFYDTWYETAYFFGMVELAWGKEFGG